MYKEDIPTATLVRPGKSIRVKLTTANQGNHQEIVREKQKSLMIEKENNRKGKEMTDHLESRC